LPIADSDPRSFFIKERGIKETTLEAYAIGVEEDAIAISYGPNLVKYRKQTDEGRRIWWNKKGIKPPLFAPPIQEGTIAFLVEGESDSMRLYQELLEGSEKGSQDVWGLSGVDSWRDDMAETFDRYDQVFVVLDNDVDYNVKAQVDAAYLRIRRAIGPKTRRIILPQETKDLCEFFDLFGIEELRALATRRAKSESRFKPLDLTLPPPPMDWLVDGLIASGDVTIAVGDPGLGKSWVAMDLSVKLANNQGEKAFWLGHEILKRGPVLYIDEENPLDVVYHRLNKLGLTETGMKNLRYLYEPKIWLNKDPVTLLEEALEFNPALIVLDSLSRVHTEDENSAGAMAQLFKEGIKPLARETGAAVLLIHHVIKSEGGSGFQRARGSGDITAVVDAGLDMRSTGVPNVFTVFNYKSRRIKGGETLTVRITDTPDNKVAITTDAAIKVF
jgi:hypothetical protein